LEETGNPNGPKPKGGEKGNPGFVLVNKAQRLCQGKKKKNRDGRGAPDETGGS